MDESRFELAGLLGTTGCAEFFRDFWEKQILHVARGAPGFYSGLLSTADVEQVIAFTRPKFVDSGAFNGSAGRSRRFVQGWLAERQLQDGVKYPNLEDIERVYAKGLTVIIMTMQDRWGPVAGLCRGLEAAFHCPVHANLYLTPAGAQGFDAHFDTHEVFVLQLEGEKQWRLYGSPRKLPLLDEKNQCPKDQLGPAREVHLQAGDLLYVPRGFVHEAYTSEQASMHLTVGVNVYRWADLLGEALTTVAREDERFREALPPEVLGASQVSDAVRGRFTELLSALGAEARVEQAVGSLNDQFFGQLKPLPGNRFVPPIGLESIALETVLEKAPGALCRVLEKGGWVTIEYPGGSVGGPLKIAEALRYVAKAERFCVQDLPDNLGAEAKIVLARRLVSERLVNVVDAGLGVHDAALLDTNGSQSVNMTAHASGPAHPAPNTSPGAHVSGRDGDGATDSAERGQQTGRAESRARCAPNAVEPVPAARAGN